MYFDGTYYKHQKDGYTICFIPGIASDSNFIQVITNDFSANYKFENCKFSKKGIKINLPDIYGEVKYSHLTPIKYDIMGPFSLFNMECRHEIVSMHHRLSGKLVVQGKEIDLSGGVGYIEKDSGRSFPKKYLWVHSNDFKEKCSIMVSIATIPFYFVNFMGCICVVVYGGKEYRFATYLGVKIIWYSEKRIVLKQGKHKLVIDVLKNEGHKLFAPKDGIMKNIIRESNNAEAVFRLYENKQLVFSLKSCNTSFEYNM